MELQPEQVFAKRFRIGARIGGGGFGDVYRAFELRDGSAVALKLLHPEIVSHPTLRERFEQEARIPSVIRSPYVVDVVDAGVDGASGRPWVAFELLTGETLDDRLARDPMPAVGVVMDLVAQLGEALGAAHQAGVIHADLKPENLFLTGPAERPFLKVLDFGIARMLKVGRTSTKVTSEVGSPLWTAPEQFIRGAKLRPSTDVWPLGMLAFRMLTGQHYLRNARGDNGVMAVVAEICVEALATATERARELGVEGRLPAEFDRWFRHCVVRAPEERFQHGRAAANALLALLRPKPAIARTRMLDAPSVSPMRVGATVALPDGFVPVVLEMLDKRDYQSARHALDAAVAKGDGAAEAWALRGECDMALGRYDEAVDDWSEAIERAPSSGAFLLGRSLAFEALGRMSAARADASVAAALGHAPARERLTLWNTRKDPAR